MNKIAEMRAEKYGKTTKEIVAVEAMKSYLQSIELKKAQRKIAAVYDVTVFRMVNGKPVPVRSTINGTRYAALIDEAVADSIKKVEKMDTILVDKLVRGLKMVDGKQVVETASEEFISFVEDADQCLG